MKYFSAENKKEQNILVNLKILSTKMKIIFIILWDFFDLKVFARVFSKNGLNIPKYYSKIQIYYI